ncbi:MAG: lysylphosphatidylglycerol synthase transmembrane domain-containing protein [Rhodothermaceae bacterium]
MSISDKSISQKIKSIIGYTLPVLLTIIFLFLAFKDIEFDEFMKHFTNVSWGYLLIFIALFFLSHIVRAYRWKTIISSVKSDVSILSLFGSTMIGYGVNLAVPRLGEIYRPSFLGQWEGISRTAMFGTIIVERVIDVIFLLVSILITVAIYPYDLMTEIPLVKLALTIGSISILGIVITLIFVVKMKEKFYSYITRIVGKVSVRFAEKLEYVFKMLIEGFSTIRSGKVLLLTIFYSAVIMFLYGFNCYVGLYMLNMDLLHDVSLTIGWTVMTISALGIVAPTPGGTGSYHYLSRLSLGLFGFSENVAVAYAVLTHIISSVLFIISTVFFVNFVNRRKEKSKRVNFFSVLKQSK